MAKLKIFVAGHNGMVGSSIIRLISSKKKYKIIICPRKIDLRNQQNVEKFFKKHKPNIVINAAAKVGGIKHNASLPAEFIYDNISISTNIIHQSYLNKVTKLINLGSACIYPKLCRQPIKEEYLLSGDLEKTNEAYAIAKIAALKMCNFYNKQYKTKYISLQPTNLYGFGDNFDLKSSHVLPALIRKFYTAKKMNKKFVEIWGSGKAKREFLFVDDLAKAVSFILNKKFKYSEINVGSGEEISIKQLALKISKVAGYKGKIRFNTSMPDGTPRRIVDNKRLKSLGWKPDINLDHGIKMTYDYYVKNYKLFK